MHWDKKSALALLALPVPLHSTSDYTIRAAALIMPTAKEKRISPSHLAQGVKARTTADSKRGVLKLKCDFPYKGITDISDRPTLDISPPGQGLTLSPSASGETWCSDRICFNDGNTTFPIHFHQSLSLYVTCFCETSTTAPQQPCTVTLLRRIWSECSLTDSECYFPKLGLNI